MSTLEWILAVGGGLVAPFVLVTVIGCFLPRKHTVSRSITLKQNAESIWQAITVFERQPAWWPVVVMVERLPDEGERPVYRQTFAGRRKHQITIVVDEAEPARRMVTRIADLRGPFHGRWIYEIAAADGGCRLTLTEEGEIANPFIRTMFRLMMNKTQFLDSYLHCLGRRFGEKVTLA